MKSIDTRYAKKIQGVIGLVASLAIVVVWSNVGFSQQASTSQKSGSEGAKCQVTSGPNKGKKGVFTEGGSWCEGDWGGTECKNTNGTSNGKCKAAALVLGDDRGIVIFDGNTGRFDVPSGGIEVAPEEQDLLSTVFLKITCTERGSDGQCNKAKCERERDPNSPTGFEKQSCAEFIVKCVAYGHTAEGGRNGATCTR